MRKEIGLQDAGAVVQHDFARGGMEQDVGQVGTPRTAEVRMRKTVDGRIVVMVSGAGVPVPGTRVGAELHHAERRRCARVGMPVVARADERVYIIDRAGRPRRARKEPEGQQGEGKFFGHGSFGVCAPSVKRSIKDKDSGAVLQTPAAVSAQHRNRSQFRLYKYKRREASRPWLFALLHPHIAQNLPIRRRNPGRSAFSPEIPSWGRKFPKKSYLYPRRDPTRPWHA